MVKLNIIIKEKGKIKTRELNGTNIVVEIEEGSIFPTKPEEHIKDILIKRMGINKKSEIINESSKDYTNLIKALMDELTK